VRAESGSSNRPGSTGPPARPFRDQLGFSYRVLVRQCCCGATLVHTTHRRAGRRAEQAGCNRAGLCVRPVDLQVRPPCWVYSNWHFVPHTTLALRCNATPPPVCHYPTGARPERAESGEGDGRTAHKPVSGPPPHLLAYRRPAARHAPAALTAVFAHRRPCRVGVQEATPFIPTPPRPSRPPHHAR